MFRTEQDELGPIDMVVIGFPSDAPVTGEAVSLLVDLVDRGTIRVIDVLRHDLVRAVWDSDFTADERVLDVHSSNLRRKLDSAGAPTRIETGEGSGLPRAPLTATSAERGSWTGSTVCRQSWGLSNTMLAGDQETWSATSRLSRMPVRRAHRGCPATPRPRRSDGVGARARASG